MKINEYKEDGLPSNPKDGDIAVDDQSFARVYNAKDKVWAYDMRDEGTRKMIEHYDDMDDVIDSSDIQNAVDLKTLAKMLGK